jgi:predicted metal-dependent phosphoesterase TrpH
MENAFDDFLVPCNVPKEYFAADEAIREIHRIGGLAVLAHPTSITRDRTMLRELIAELIRYGLDGLEAMNNMASIDETDFLSAIARRHGLLVTGGSDFHGNSDEELGICDGRHPVDYRLVEALKERLAARG